MDAMLFFSGGILRSSRSPAFWIFRNLFRVSYSNGTLQITLRPFRVLAASYFLDIAQISASPISPNTFQLRFQSLLWMNAGSSQVMLGNSCNLATVSIESANPTSE